MRMFVPTLCILALVTSAGLTTASTHGVTPDVTATAVAVASAIPPRDSQCSSECDAVYSAEVGQCDSMYPLGTPDSTSCRNTALVNRNRCYNGC